ncbi:MAG: ATP-binding cassette domain-containing protein [Rhizobiaceae bacterium]|nr:ATP-binding cassette domain-containing protein [Rhizobiaceae bacterium]
MKIDINNAQKRYGSHQALADISLVADDGELLVLLGPSGSGKTTLLRSIAGLETIDSGQILFGTRPVNDLDPADRNVGMVFQDYALYPHLSVRNNIAYNMKIRKLGSALIEQRVKEVAEMLEIAPYLDRKPAELSGGQRQRVAVARAITRDAEVLLMDEPLSNLDAQIREHVRVELRELQKRLGVTTVYVTHDQVEAMVMADRLAVMSNGRIEQIGSPAEIYDRPATLFCARFVGSPKINEVRGTLEQGTDGLYFTLGGSTELKLKLTQEDGQSINEKTDVILAFRAEDAVVSGDGIPLAVSLVENRGAEKFVVASLAPQYRGSQISADIRVRLSRGDDVSSQAHLLPIQVHLFDGKSGARLAGARHAPKA